MFIRMGFLDPSDRRAVIYDMIEKGIVFTADFIERRIKNGLWQDRLMPIYETITCCNRFGN